MKMVQCVNTPRTKPLDLVKSVVLTPIYCTPLVVVGLEQRGEIRSRSRRFDSGQDRCLCGERHGPQVRPANVRPSLGTLVLIGHCPLWVHM